MAMRWRWPPESLTPRSPTMVVHAFRQRVDERQALRRRGGLEHLLVGRLGAAVADVLRQRAVEQGGVLRHDGQRLPQAEVGRARDVLAVNQMRPPSGG